MPEWYLDTPAVLSCDEQYIEAFWELNSCRFFPDGPIPWTVMRQYAMLQGIEGVDFDIFVLVLREMDNVFRETINKKTKTVASKNNTNNKASKIKARRKR